jgi:hypothetical protein
MGPHQRSARHGLPVGEQLCVGQGRELLSATEQLQEGVLEGVIAVAPRRARQRDGPGHCRGQAHDPRVETVPADHRLPTSWHGSCVRACVRACEIRAPLRSPRLGLQPFARHPASQAQPTTGQ